MRVATWIPVVAEMLKTPPWIAAAADADFVSSNHGKTVPLFHERPQPFNRDLAAFVKGLI
ncbi:MAG: hypothetical protein ACM3NQ_03450 [Bacteroidales bacterium]